MSWSSFEAHALTFLLSTSGAVFVGSIKTRAVCIVVLLCCLVYAGLAIWLSAGFGGSGGRPPVPTEL